ncbi:chemotaxis protein CheB [Aromatoleum buckelii]|uniref:protein-glutamate methylesterase n=1 Tax=Aromatoleum buckelii TaxID=200254 RepID=A0ABX1N850_9RHOO|nr:chemotaxis protein CheB [Aromatoleum buckelii]MCK0511627.1 chemotaxis protein CheB [Aromatoleum buckelii]
MSSTNSSPFRVIVIGASAGGVEALRSLTGALPENFPAAVFVVLHLSRDSPSVLPDILSRAGPLPANRAVDGEPIHSGRIYVAPPDFHLLVEPDQVRMSRGPRENNVRPAIDPLFRSAAIAYGPAVIGVVLTGNLYDGAAGLRSIKLRGGTTVVQDPRDALFPSMPQSALRQTEIDHCVPLHEIPRVLVSLAKPLPAAAEVGAPTRGPQPDLHSGPSAVSNPQSRQTNMAKTENAKTNMTTTEIDAVEAKIAEGSANSEELLRRIASPAPYVCPECHGALWEIRDDTLIRFRCRVGHAYTLESLLTEQDEAIEEALWVAVRALEERATLNARMAERVEQQQFTGFVQHFRDRERESTHHAQVVRRLLQGGIDKLAPK